MFTSKYGKQISFCILDKYIKAPKDLRQKVQKSEAHFKAKSCLSTSSSQFAITD